MFQANSKLNEKSTNSNRYTKKVLRTTSTLKNQNGPTNTYALRI